MKPNTLLFIAPCLLLALTACSPPDQSDNVLQGQMKALEKAKHVEKIGFDHKSQIDQVERQPK